MRLEMKCIANDLKVNPFGVAVDADFGFHFVPLKIKANGTLSVEAYACQKYHSF
jgi:hypothetical protein